MREIEIKLFGAFRNYVPTGMITIKLVDQLTAIQLKQKIQNLLQNQIKGFQDSTLVFESALATETEVLDEGEVINDKSNLALLPPVCGG
ncbi:MAG: hypothetical protein IPM57_10095 [Oligoflexia bacterium]|nr:hypothetical protein [Oligoflexia bacterium]